MSKITFIQYNTGDSPDAPEIAGEFSIFTRDDNLLYALDSSNTEYLLSGSSYELISYSDLSTLKSNSNLQTTTLYRINNRSATHPNTTGDVFVYALSNNLLSKRGYMLAKLPVYTGSATINSVLYDFEGIWDPSTTYNNAEDTVIYEGSMWRSLNATGNLNQEPGVATTFWEIVDDDDVYNHEIVEITYDFDNDWIESRADSLGNYVKYEKSIDDLIFSETSEKGIEQFQWGNTNIHNNIVDNSILDCLNINSNVQNNKILGNSNITLNDYNFTDNIIESAVTYTTSKIYTGKEFSNRLNTFDISYDISGSTVVVIPNEEYLINITSSNASETLVTINGVSKGNKVKIKPENGLTLTVNETGNIVLTSTSHVLNGSNGDFIELEYDGSSTWYEINFKIY